MNRKLNQFISWLCGEDIPFPYFKNMPKVEMPLGAEDKQEEPDKYQHLNEKDDIFSQEKVGVKK